VTITLEAKSSGDVPSLGALDFAGLQSHMLAHNAVGCLLVAPAYPGLSRGSESQAAIRAQIGRISCWTVKQLADVVEAIESRHITASTILEIITTAFMPEDVASAVKKLLSEPTADYRELYVAILLALAEHREDVTDAERSVGLIAGWVTSKEEFRKTRMEIIVAALRHMAEASRGAMNLRSEGPASSGVVLIHTSIEELARRLEGITGSPGLPRKRGRRRDGDDDN